MAVALEQFVRQLEDCRILTGDALNDFIPPKASPKDAEELARELVRQKKLTKFQAEMLWQGKGKSLVLGNYLLLEKIGQGGMGAVYRAEHRKMHRIVAVKMLPRALVKDQAAIARFEREVTAAARLRHPNIVAADDADEANGVHFLVMECVDGSDLAALVKKNGPLPVDQAVNCIRQGARGLEAAHAQGIIHRDIKPGNLLLSETGVVKILDMGLARIESANQTELTATGAIMGTVDYMAPEQARSIKTVDGRADIYSLGCSLFYLLTGRAAYEGDTLTVRLLAHQNDPVPSLRSVRPDVPESVDTIFAKMVAKNVEDRYQSMTEVIAALERCPRDGEPSPAVLPTPPLSFDSDVAEFLKDISAGPANPALTSAVRAKSAAAAPSKRTWMVAAALAVVLLISGALLKLGSKKDTPIAAGNESGAAAQARRSEGQVQTAGDRKSGPKAISVDGAELSADRTAADDRKVAANAPQQVASEPSRLMKRRALTVLSAEYGSAGKAVNLTERLNAGAKDGRLVVFVEPELSGRKTSGELYLRAQIGNEVTERTYGHREVAFLDARGPQEIPRRGLVILDGLYGTGIWGEDKMVDVKKLLDGRIDQGQVRLAVRELVSGIPDPAPGASKVLIVRYALDGEIQMVVFEEHQTVELG